MAPTHQQISSLKGFLLEFYQYQRKHYETNDDNILSYIDNSLKDPLKESQPEFHRCLSERLDIAEGFPIAHRNEKGDVIAVQLRPITADQIQNTISCSYADATKKLVASDLPKKILLGCGNNPTSVCFHFPYQKDRFRRCCNDFAKEMCCDDNYETPESWSKTIISQKEKEVEKNHIHLHEDYITIDPNIVMNPTVVGEFGEWCLPFLPNNYFECIHMEGISLEKTKIFKEEEARILVKSS